MAAKALTNAHAPDDRAGAGSRIAGVRIGRWCRSRPNAAANDTVQAPALFDGAERLAILIGTRDRAPLLDPAGRLTRLLALFFGVQGPQPLADPRLEALRRLAVAMRHRPRRVSAAIDAALAAGVPHAKIDLLLVHMNFQSLERCDG